jgi:HTH-type transcriptional regulator / antitoxin HigA
LEARDKIANHGGEEHVMNEAPYEPDWFSKPGDTLAELLSRRQLSYRELAEQLKEDADTVAGVLAGTVAISSRFASRLATCLGGTKEFWIRRQATYEAALSRVAASIPSDAADAWLKQFSSKALVNTGLIRRSGSKHDAIKSFLAFFGVSSPNEWERRYANFPNDVVFRNSTAFETNRSSLALWLRQGELEATKVRTSKWDSVVLRASIAELRKFSKWKSPSDFVPALRATCAAAGIAVVFVRAPYGCRASGASRFMSPDKAVVILSFRHLSDDHFWFTFFHEIGHILLHGKDATFVDHEDTVNNEREAEANAFAATALIPLSRHEELVSLEPRLDPIVRFAVSVGVAPGVVVGQLQHCGCIPRDKMNFLKRRYNWDQIAAAFS